jgi:hypothetical protein
MALRQEITAQAVGNLAGIDPVILLLGKAIARSMTGCATFTAA